MDKVTQKMDWRNRRFWLFEWHRWDSVDDPDFVQPDLQKQRESEYDFSDTEFVVNETLNINRHNRPSASRRSRSRSPLSNTASLLTYYLGKDNITKWNVDGPPLNVRARSHNIILHSPGVKRCAEDAKSIVDCWSLFFPNTVIRKKLKIVQISI